MSFFISRQVFQFSSLSAANIAITLNYVPIWSYLSAYALSACHMFLVSCYLLLFANLIKNIVFQQTKLGNFLFFILNEPFMAENPP